MFTTLQYHNLMDELMMPIKLEIVENLFVYRKSNSNRIFPQQWIFRSICHENGKCHEMQILTKSLRIKVLGIANPVSHHCKYMFSSLFVIYLYLLYFILITYLYLKSWIIFFFTFILYLIVTIDLLLKLTPLSLFQISYANSCILPCV